MSSRVSRRRFMAGGSGLAASLIGSARAQEKANPARGRVDVEGLVEDLKRAGKGADGQPAVRAVLERAVSEPGALLAGIGEPREAGIHTLYHAPDLTILDVVWAPLMVLLPHNHKMWATIGIYTGREDNIFWRRLPGANDGTIEAAGAKALSVRDAAPLGRDIIHSVTNPIPRLTGALHVYGGDFFDIARSQWDPETLAEVPYSIERAMRVFEEANARSAPSS